MKFQSLVLFLLIPKLALASFPSDYMTLKDSEGREIFAKILRIEGRDMTIELRSNRQQFPLAFDRLSDSSKERVADWVKDNVSASMGERLESGEEAPEGEDESILETNDDGKLFSKFYPRSRSEVKDGIREIEKRDRPDDIDKENFEAVTELNIFRFLCGVDAEVRISESLVEKAQAAAVACEKAGEISHDLGSFTDRCNLSAGVGNAARTVGQYIDDSGDNNRERRGHRRWCLYPKLSETGFGVEGKMSAMHCFEHGGRDSRDPHAYPGMGFFPSERMLGNGWSLYLTSDAPPKGELKVEVYKLAKRPTKSFGWTSEIPGRKIDVDFVYTYSNAINFEPDSGSVKSRGIYFVRITGGGVKEQYLTEFY